MYVMGRRRKMTLADMTSAGITYHDFHRVKNKYGLLGWLYVLDKPLTRDQFRALHTRWENVTTGTAQHRHAPEIQYSTLILWDRCLTVINSFDAEGSERRC